jgi:hypothetical protein
MAEKHAASLLFQQSDPSITEAVAHMLQSRSALAAFSEVADPLNQEPDTHHAVSINDPGAEYVRFVVEDKRVLALEDGENHLIVLGTPMRTGTGSRTTKFELGELFCKHRGMADGVAYSATATYANETLLELAALTGAGFDYRIEAAGIRVLATGPAATMTGSFGGGLVQVATHGSSGWIEFDDVRRLCTSVVRTDGVSVRWAPMQSEDLIYASETVDMGGIYDEGTSDWGQQLPTTSAIMAAWDTHDVSLQVTIRMSILVRVGPSDLTLMPHEREQYSPARDAWVYCLRSLQPVRSPNSFYPLQRIAAWVTEHAEEIVTYTGGALAAIFPEFSPVIAGVTAVARGAVSAEKRKYKKKARRQGKRSEGVQGAAGGGGAAAEAAVSRALTKIQAINRSLSR